MIESRMPARLGLDAGSRHRSEDEQGAFFQAALDRTLAAEARIGAIERSFALAGFVLSLRFAGDALERSFTPALAHLEVPSTSRPDAIFHIWDGQSTGVDMAPPPCPPGCFTSRGDIWTMGSRRFRSAYIWSEYALYLFDTVTATGIYWTPAAGPLPYWAKASPLRCLFHWWAETRGCQLVHGAAVGSDDGAVLITGKGGVGKSTTALACLGSGLRYVGDDYVVVQLDPSPRVHSLYGTAKLNWDQMARFPGLAHLAAHREGAGSEKAVLHLYPERRGQIARSLPLRAILTPRIGDRPQAGLEAVSTLALQRAVSFTTLSQLPHAGHRTHAFIERLVERLPGRRLVLGSNLDAIAAVIVPLASAGADRPASRTGSDESTIPPLVSVIIAACNGARFLPDSVASVLAQEYPAIEIIVVDGGSVDEIDDAVQRLPVDVRLLKQHDGGPAVACNRGLQECSGDLVAFLDADDLWPPGSLRAMVDLLTGDGGCDVVRGRGRVMSAAPGRTSDAGSGGPSTSDGAAIYRREAFQKVGLFEQGSWPGKDGDWFDRAREQGSKLRQLDEVTLLIRSRDAEADPGTSLHELNSLRLLKRVLDRERAEGRLRAGDGEPPSGGR